MERQAWLGRRGRLRSLAVVVVVVGAALGLTAGPAGGSSGSSGDPIVTAAVVGAGAVGVGPAVGPVAIGTKPVELPELASPSKPTSTATSSSTSWLRVEGNQLVDAAGQPIVLHGVDRSGTEYACVQGWGIFDGPFDAASVAAIASWGVNAVRIPLNEDCWLGINGVKPAYSGTNYRKAIEAYVDLLEADHVEAILDLHWSAPGTELATGQAEMADADHSPAFWSSVAGAFRAQPNVMFDLFNEPEAISWSCWLKGCEIPASGGHPAWQAAGMQTLVDAVRNAGATQPIMLGGVDWATNLEGWLAHEPVDPLHQLVASFHVYNFTGCSTTSCWDSTVLPVARAVPVVTGEVGQNTCGGHWASSYLDWANQHGISYLAWTWDTWGCPYGLVTSYDGSPSAWGRLLLSDLRSLPSQPQL